MYLVNKSWFYDIIGDVVSLESEPNFYSCDNLEDIHRIAREITIPSYEFMKKKNLAWYINYRTTFFYLMEFGIEEEKLQFERLQDVIIIGPSKKSYDFFIDSFYEVLWKDCFGELKLSLDINDYKIVDDPSFSALNFFGNYYYE